MIKRLLAKTNSWHWAVAALLTAALLTFGLWWMTVMPARAEAARQLAALNSRLALLNGLTEARIAKAAADEKSADAKRAAAKQAFDALGIEPLPLNAEAVFPVKNRVDAALAVRRLRIVANELAEGASPKPARAGRAAPPTDDQPKTGTYRSPYPTAEFRYTVTGTFRDMFLFLWTESARKTLYSLKDICIVCRDGGEMRMTFVLQVSHR